MSLIDCPPCRGTGVLRQIDIGDLLSTADLPEHEQPWETTPCPICGGKGAAIKAATPRQRTRAECITAADAIEGALHLLDDEQSAQILATLADQWRTEADEASC